jgi:hypothetical protein
MSKKILQYALSAAVALVTVGILRAAWSTYDEVRALRIEMTRHNEVLEKYNKEIQYIWEQVAERTADQWALEREIERKKKR